ncbi:glycosyltransferase family 9 protein [Streptomyces collinus]|uniref:glycosyltransferase family 9 protein n=1 Tax=Streptomyces collinus TaxID=42684 RepID=UPI00380690E9
MADASAVIGCDTGIAHVAVAHGTRSIALSGPVAPSRWGPPPDPRHRALRYGPESDPHGRRPGPALLRVTVEDVLGAVGELPGAPRP